MFENCSILIIKSGGRTPDICRLEIDAETQATICDIFSKSIEDMRSGKSAITFDGSYKPHDDEYLAIENFQLCDEIKDAIRDPIGVTAYTKEDGKYPEIRAIFVGVRTKVGGVEEFIAAFQRFRKEQYISLNWINLFFEKDTFFQEKRFGISISDTIDCCYDENGLQFTSFFYARQIFDLSEYYRSASDREVQNFTANDKLVIEDIAGFMGMANSRIRRKIALINDSRVLENYSASKIKSLAEATGIAIVVDNKKIVIPNDKDKVKIILGFLDEEAFRGPFSQATYLANSKRKVVI